ncbi:MULTISPECIES: ABC transporter permease [Acidiphilium]|uniref:Monosaccharide ABC transporter membrane protein, CUT2 family n=1 Tax=Acidiphilium rubrum TaxID=526 RepID=A0A8G2CKJ0_ACIRU|nr:MULTISPECIES: ABC transporter permease [Acidiphilium]MBW4036318.1 ABC transporter permease [Pseudomonadota bacterium]OYW03784.1 MAG: ABC transporter permease [Acidiphilium sp. 37-64-53]OZB30389.1 MAG: ABC transporter permease [Acidiphilium sp. 34-64-41]SIQ77986.1 monosaccharide ABC transporter membrane protein, CUT2 family [Acidiphilium rubrum]HQT83536.1 ABC transporter permease [Acidiphilium rubrum]
MQPDTTADALPRGNRLGHLIAQNIGLILAGAILLIAIVAFILIYGIEQQRLPGNFELTSTVNSAVPLAFAAVGQCFVVLTKGIDLSVGGVVDLANAMAAVTMGKSLTSGLVWSVVILMVGAACGLVNGLLVALGRLQPIVVTLGTLSIYQGLAIRVLPEPGGAIPPSFTNFLVNPNAPYALIFIVLLALAWSAFRRSRAGVDLYAIGNDEAAARALGVNILRTKIIAYMLDGTLAAAAGLFLAASATAGDATTGNSYTLSSIVAVVLGGVSLFGGRGSAIGAIAGALITTLIVNILFFGHVNPLFQSFYEGVFLLIAVVVGGVIGGTIRRRPK